MNLSYTGLKEFMKYEIKKKGGGPILERRNVERPIFRNFKITNIKITKGELGEGTLPWAISFFFK